MNWKVSTVFTLIPFLVGCNQKNTENSEIGESQSAEINQGLELVKSSLKQTGDYKMLRSKKDVVYTYSYTTPDGKTDVSTEKYIFDGELSYGKYETHERTFPQMDGVVEQSFDGTNYWLRHNGKLVSDTTALKRVAFNRPTNFYWFAMFQKLTDPGLTYEYLGTQDLQDQSFDVVKISFESAEKPRDIYQVYINKETRLIDQFLFTVAEFGMVETPLLMQVEYEEVKGLLIPSKRKYNRSTWEAEVSDSPWIEVNWTDITFDNGLRPNEFNLSLK